MIAVSRLSWGVVVPIGNPAALEHCEHENGNSLVSGTGS